MSVRSSSIDSALFINTKSVLLLAVGSFGDVIPFLNLGIGLRQRGHNVIIATTSIYRRFVLERGFEFRTIGWDLIDYIENNNELSLQRNNYEDAERMLNKIEFVILGIGSMYMYPECIIRDIPMAYICTYPWSSAPKITEDIYSFDSLQWIPFQLNFKMRKTFDYLVTVWSDMENLPIYNQKLLELGLESVEKVPWSSGGSIETNQIPVIHISNRHLIKIPLNPKNINETQIDYPYLKYENELDIFEADPDLDKFLNEGRKPIYFGYGTNNNNFVDEIERIRLWLEVMQKLPENQRAIFCDVGDVDIQELNDEILNGRIFILNYYVPHSWLFPQLSCVVFHGGIGTTHSVIRAGVPSLIVYNYPEQSWWASILYRHGLTSNAGFHVNAVDSDKIYESLLDVLTDIDLKKRCESLGMRLNRKLNKKDGVTKILNFIEGYWDKTNWDDLDLNKNHHLHSDDDSNDNGTITPNSTRKFYAENTSGQSKPFILFRQIFNEEYRKYYEKTFLRQLSPLASRSWKALSHEDQKIFKDLSREINKSKSRKIAIDNIKYYSPKARKTRNFTRVEDLHSTKSNIIKKSRGIFK
nr:13068_t:CDS:10 [Entrophospora candida]